MQIGINDGNYLSKKDCGDMRNFGHTKRFMQHYAEPAIAGVFIIGAVKVLVVNLLDFFSPGSGKNSDERGRNHNNHGLDDMKRRR